MSTIGLIGGTGNEGRGLALRFVIAGEKVVIGSRSSDRAERAAATIREQFAAGAERILAAANADAAVAADILCICLPVSGVEETLDPLRVAVDGKTVIEVVNPVQRTRQGFEPIALPAPSAAEWVARLLPRSAVVSAFKTLSARDLCDAGRPLDGDAFVCGDDEPSKRKVVDIIGRIANLNAIDCGPLRNARYIEAATVLLLELNRRHRAVTSLRILGLDRPHPH